MPDATLSDTAPGWRYTLPDACTVEVDFKLPVVLPGRVALSVWEEGDERRLALSDAASGKPHLTGTIRPR